MKIVNPISGKDVDISQYKLLNKKIKEYNNSTNPQDEIKYYYDENGNLVSPNGDIIPYKYKKGKINELKLIQSSSKSNSKLKIKSKSKSKIKEREEDPYKEENAPDIPDVNLNSNIEDEDDINLDFSTDYSQIKSKEDLKFYNPEEFLEFVQKKSSPDLVLKCIMTNLPNEIKNNLSQEVDFIKGKEFKSTEFGKKVQMKMKKKQFKLRRRSKTKIKTKTKKIQKKNK